MSQRGVSKDRGSDPDHGEHSSGSGKKEKGRRGRGRFAGRMRDSLPRALSALGLGGKRQKDDRPQPDTQGTGSTATSGQNTGTSIHTPKANVSILGQAKDFSMDNSQINVVGGAQYNTQNYFGQQGKHFNLPWRL
ncbi:hypothetical protein D9758_018516 [Tetrapyrgos nigripes]|uniref:Uncharacterized protein n=1 Tax=Tetrapyrgos nigripes TaxID=182062 RepID=A0A8H5FD92_9AGAR|nr:hypothetical protein D9758_018516 [Tetrapyrgos nigripes]